MFFTKTKKLLQQTQVELDQYKNELDDYKNNFDNAKSQIDNLKLQLQKTTKDNNEITNRYAHFIDREAAIKKLDQEIISCQRELHELNIKYQNGLQTYSELESEVSLYRDTLEIGSFGLYEPQFDFQTSENYKNALEYNYDKQKLLIKSDKGAICNTEWSVGGSKVEGRKMTNQYKKLMLFAFNGECDACIAKVKWNNAAKTKERIQKAFENINKLGITQNVHLANELLNLKFEELYLTHEYELKIHAEKEEQRRIREQMREEEKVQREFERAQRDAEDEERRFQKALDAAKNELGTSSPQNVAALNEQIASLEVKLKEAQEKKERAISLAQQTKVGHIYVISNIGSFGEDVYKIGLTRRLDPLDRVRELGDASVPFYFDVHAIIYSENAPQLENELHKKFADKRLNRINGRKEFFKVSLDEIEAIVKQHADAEIQFTKIAEAKEYRETLTMLEKLKQSVDEPLEQHKFPGSLN